MIREFHLSPRRTGGASCDKGGAFVGAIPILHRLQRNGKDEWRLRDCDGLSDEIGRQYGLPVDMSSKMGGLQVVAKALNEGNLARAQIATVLLGIPDPPPLSKAASSRQRAIKLVRDLHWSGILKWDPDAHPRWPAGSADGTGGQFAPKGEGGEADGSQSSRSDATHSYNSQQYAPRRNARIQLAAAEGEDDREPRFGVGGNHPPPEELIPQRLQQSPAGPAVQFLDNLLDISGPGDEANLDAATLQMRALLHAIHQVDPNYVYESIEPPGGLAGMSWQGRADTIFGLQADLAAVIYRIRGDIKPLQEVTLGFMQRRTNAAYDKAVVLYNKGKLKIRLSPQEAIGNYVDGFVRLELRDFFNNLRISIGPGSAIRVNSRAYNSSNAPPSYRLPDLRIGNVVFDTSLRAKAASDPQIKGFFGADFAPTGVVIVRPDQLGAKSSYIIWRANGE